MSRCNSGLFGSIGSLVVQYFTETRDYAVVTDDPEEVSEIIECFEADWSRSPFDRGDQARLIWCNTNGGTSDPTRAAFTIGGRPHLRAAGADWSVVGPAPCHHRRL